MPNDIYTQLREFMDKLPSGFPATPTGVEIKLLKKMFTPEQAELTMKLTRQPESVSEIAARTEMDEADLTEKLETLARDGLIFRIREGDKRLYRAYQFVVGLYEFQLNRMDREFAELFEEYLPHLGMMWAQLKTDQMRILPVESSIDEKNQVASYNRVRELVQKETIFSVNPCICRKEQGLLDNRCEKPLESCLMFGDWAQYYIDNQLGRQIDLQEVFGILDLAEENGQVLRVGNSKALDAVCTCCSCCCPSLRGIKSLPNPGEMVVAYYKSTVDPELCTGCGECMDICPMEAITDKDDIAVMSDKRCIGCGLCVNRCPVEALSMKELESMEAIPADTFDEVQDRIAAERGLQ